MIAECGPTRDRSGGVNLGRHLRERRVRAKLSQQDLASRLGISQRLYSYFESGQIALSAERLAIAESVIDTAEIGALSAAIPPMRLLSHREFYAVLHSMLADWKYLSAWYFGPCDLPVLDDRYNCMQMRDLLRLGTDVHVLWRLDDYLSDERFQFIESALCEVAISATPDHSLKPKTGRLFIDGLVNSNANHELSPCRENAKRFISLKALLERASADHCTVCGPIYPSAPNYVRFRNLIHYGWDAPIVFFEGNLGANSLAAVLMDDVSNDPKSVTLRSTGWTCLSRKTTASLLLHCHAFEEVSAATGDPK